MDIDLVNEGSTVVFRIVLTDENGESATPDSLSWSVLTNDETVVATGTSTPGATTSVVVNGTWLVRQNEYDQGYRSFVSTCLYDSNLQSGLQVVGVYRFKIVDVLGV